MFAKKLTVLALFLTLSSSLTMVSFAQDQSIQRPDPSKYEWVPVVDGFDLPLYITSAHDGSNRLFIMEQGGLIWIYKDGNVSLDPFLDISALLTRDVFSGGYTERGLLGLAFHSDFENNGLFFINYINSEGNTAIARYKVKDGDPDHADPDSAKIILTVQQPFENHNGGQLAFGPDGYLYIGLGDGGSLFDPLRNGQNMTILLAKILRIDINTDTYKIPPDNPFASSDKIPEAWAVGLRNPWRFSFDRETNDLYIADVGEATWEELDYQPANSKGGENYGWSLYEGYARLNQDPLNVNVTKPIFVYKHDIGCSITGGYVYRGQEIPELNGVYFFGDYCYGHTWTTYRNDGGDWITLKFLDTGRQISSFGEDEAGELYMVDYKGVVLKLQRKP
jgi:glucose/arabinose dehydrogenase